VARNRKRAKERRSRRPAPAQVSRPGVATAGAERNEIELDTPAALQHAAPDVELADAQVALGRPEFASDNAGADAQPDDGDADAEPDDGDAGAFPDELEEADSDGSGGRSGGGGRDVAVPGSGASGAAVPAHRPGIAHRLISFLQGSWRELQRVQWPDRRQVVQATGVVIGFVIVAGVYLGVADTLATRLMNFILK
jgi:preprotein translocase subunit SecE